MVEKAGMSHMCHIECNATGDSDVTVTTITKPHHPVEKGHGKFIRQNELRTPKKADTPADNPPCSFVNILKTVAMYMAFFAVVSI